MFRLKLMNTRSKSSSHTYSNNLNTTFEEMHFISPIKYKSQTNINTTTQQHQQYSYNPNKNGKIHSSMAYKSTSVSHSLRSTPDNRGLNQAMTPLMNVKKMNPSRSHQHLDSIQADEYNTPPQSAAPYNDACHCVLCVNEYKVNNAQLRTIVALDSKRFVNCLNQLRPTVKVERAPNYSDIINEAIEQASSHRLSRHMSKKYSNRSKVELWKEKEVMDMINRPHVVVKQDKPPAHVIVNKNVTIEKTVEDNQTRLINLFKEFKLNPDLSPLLMNKLDRQSNGSVENTKPETPLYYRRPMPTNPPVTPLGLV